MAPNPLLLSGIVLAGANNATRVESEGQSGILTALGLAALATGIVWVIAQPITATVEVSPDAARFSIQGRF